MYKRLLALAIAPVVLFAACGSDSTDPATASEATDTDDGPARGGELVYALQSYPEPIDPLMIYTSSGTTVATAMFDTLLTIDADGAVQPLLSSGVDSPDDGRTWVVPLVEGVTFHDGTPFDADAVVGHFDRLRDPANECECLGQIGGLESVEATGPMEVTFVLDAPDAAFPTVLADTPGMIAAEASTADHPIGTGPFTFVEARQDESITVEANPEYWQEGLPYLDRVVYRAVPDASSRYASVQSGEVHLYEESSYVRMSEVRADDDLALIEYGGFGSYYILLNLQAPPFDDPDARLALATALDLETMHETFNAGEVEPATSIFPRSSWAYPGEIDSYPTFDLEEAKGLVEELGGLSFTMLAPQLVYEQALIAQAMFADAGMDVEIETGENLAIIEKYRAGDFQAAYTAYSAGLDPSVFPSSFSSDNPRNFGGVADEELDRLIAESTTTVDRDERAAIFAEIAERMAEQLPIIVISNYDDAWVASPEVQDVPATPDGILRPAAVWLDA